MKKRTFLALVATLFLTIFILSSCGFLDSLDSNETLEPSKISESKTGESKTDTSTTTTESNVSNTTITSNNQDIENTSFLVKVNIEFSANIFFDIYDMDFFLDGDFIETIPHGENKNYTFELKGGTHIFKVMNAPNDSFKTECEIEVDDNISTTLYLKGHDGYMDFYEKSSTSLDVHNITYNLDDGTNNQNNPARFISSDNTQLYPATKEYYNFIGWSYNGNIITMISKGINSDITLTAVFEPIEYDITYNDSGANNTNPTKYSIESEIVLADAVKNGATFINWTDQDGKVVTKIEKGTTGNITLKANFQYEEYSITYNMNDGTYSGTLKTTYTSADSFDLPIIEKENYTFVTWRDSSGNSITKIEKGTIGNLVLTAEFVENYSITYNMNDGTYTGTLKTAYTILDSFDLPILEKNGYTFVTWKDSSDNSITKIEKGTTGNLVLTAVFVEKEYSISYILNGGVNDTANPTKFTISSNSFVFKDAKKYKSTFVGWYKNSNFTGNAITNITDLNSNTSTISNVTLYAKFESDYNFDLAYFATNDAGEATVYLLFDTSKRIVKQINMISKTVDTAKYTGDLNSSSYLYSILLNYVYSNSQGTASFFRVSSTLTSNCILVMYSSDSNAIILFKECASSIAIATISSIDVTETNETYASLPTTTPEVAYTAEGNNNQNFYLYVDFKNKNWLMLKSDGTSILNVGDGSFTNYKETSTYITFYTNDTFRTIKILKSNLVKCYVDSDQTNVEFIRFK